MKYTISHDYEMSLAKAPLLAYDGKEDFVLWQEKARKKLTELLGIDTFQKCDDALNIKSEKDCGDYTRIDFEFQSEETYFVPCSLLVPKGLSKPIPVSICLQGHSTGMHISLGEPKFENDANSIAGGRDFAVRAVKEGYCAIAMEQRYMGVCGQSKENGSPICLKNSALSAVLLGRTAIGERAWDVSRLIDVIEKHFTNYIDTSKIICMGNSGGGTTTFYASCLDERIHLSMPSCAVCTYDHSIMAMHHCCCNFVPGIRKYFNMGDLLGLIVPRKLVVVSGIEDGIFPIQHAIECVDVVKPLYEKFGNPAFCHHVKGNGGHQFYPDDAWPIVNDILDK